MKSHLWLEEDAATEFEVDGYLSDLLQNISEKNKTEYAFNIFAAKTTGCKILRRGDENSWPTSTGTQWADDSFLFAEFQMFSKIYVGIITDSAGFVINASISDLAAFLK